MIWWISYAPSDNGRKIMFAKLLFLLAEYDTGNISERCLSFLLALQTLDYLEAPRIHI